MLLVLIAAVVSALGVAIVKRRRHADYLRASDEYLTAMRYREIGKIDLLEAVLASERLMNAQLDICRTKDDEIVVRSAHLARAHDLIEQEKPNNFHHDPEACIAQAEAALSKCKERLGRLRGLR